MKTLNIETEIEILNVLKKTYFESCKTENHVSYSFPPLVTEFLCYTGNELALTLVKHICFCIPDDVMCQLMALPPSQLRDVPSLTPSAGQPSSSHSTSEKMELVKTTQNKGFYCKKGSFSSAFPSIQSHISSRLCYALSI